MALSAEHTLAIHQLISLHGHLVDDQDLDRIDQVFTPDIVYDLDGLGYGTLRGLDAFRTAAVEVGDRNPVGHHVTNTIVTEGADGEVRARSKGIGILRDGRAGSVVYDDRLRLTPAGWRIAHRAIRPSQAPPQQPST
jgi:3-phenylpropionate/cinnamic acid dioxygenase small subunit